MKLVKGHVNLHHVLRSDAEMEEMGATVTCKLTGSKKCGGVENWNFSQSLTRADNGIGGKVSLSSTYVNWSGET